MTERIFTSQEEAAAANRPRPVQVLTDADLAVPRLPEPGSRVVRVPRADLGVQGRAGARPAGKRRRVADRTWSRSTFSSWGSPRRMRRR